MTAPSVPLSHSSLAPIASALSRILRNPFSTIAQKLAVATEFTQALDTTAELTAYSGDAATALARGMRNQVNGTTTMPAAEHSMDVTLIGTAELMTN